MNFKVLDGWGTHNGEVTNRVFLRWDNWNDWSFYTLFGIFYIDEKGERHELGGVKIAYLGQRENDRVLRIGQVFNYVGDNFFSVGNSEEYYEKLNELPAEVRDSILFGLNDIAKNPQLYEIVKNERVVQVSFMRDLTPGTIAGQYRRMAEGGARLTPYSFYFNHGFNNNEEGLRLLFDVFPESLPPTNVHVLIGKNGVGKTTLMSSMIDSLIEGSIMISMRGNFHFNKIYEFDLEANSFANLISVSFSAFDDFDLRADAKFINEMKYSYIGLRRAHSKDMNFEIKDLKELCHEFFESLKVCKSRNLVKRLGSAFQTLESDSNIDTALLLEIINDENLESKGQEIYEIFLGLSSGHKVILLTITSLVEKLQEKSLLLIDEPEAHLHPPLLSSFIRAVSDLLITTNGVAIISTHSPVILQEVPRSCVWNLRRSGEIWAADRLKRESFGENVGVLTNDVFGLEVTNSGFYKMLFEKIKDCGYDYESVLKNFNYQLGSEGRALLMALIAENFKG